MAARLITKVAIALKAAATAMDLEGEPSKGSLGRAAHVAAIFDLSVKLRLAPGQSRGFLIPMSWSIPAATVQRYCVVGKCSCDGRWEGVGRERPARLAAPEASRCCC
jgi:hypothetical protein